MEFFGELFVWMSLYTQRFMNGQDFEEEREVVHCRISSATLSPRSDGLEARTSERGLDESFTIEGLEGCVPIHN